MCSLVYIYELLLYKMNRLTLSTLSGGQLLEISLDIFPVIASGAGVYSKAISDKHTISTQHMLQLVVYIMSKTASFYLLNLSRCELLRD